MDSRSNNQKESIDDYGKPKKNNRRNLNWTYLQEEIDSNRV